VVSFGLKVRFSPKVPPMMPEGASTETLWDKLKKTTTPEEEGQERDQLGIWGTPKCGQHRR